MDIGMDIGWGGRTPYYFHQCHNRLSAGSIIVCCDYEPLYYPFNSSISVLIFTLLPLIYAYYLNFYGILDATFTFLYIYVSFTFTNSLHFIHRLNLFIRYKVVYVTNL